MDEFMTSDRDRLIELKRQAVNYAQEKADERGGLVCIDDEVDYLLANGVIVPPCKVGDDIWILRGDEKNGWITLKPTHAEKVEGGFNLAMLNCITGELQSFYFLTKEEAEEELEKRGKDNDR